MREKPMNSTPVLFPSGTLRQKYEKESGNEIPEIDATLSALAEVLAAEYVDPSLVWTAKYLVATEVKLAPNPEAQLALTLIVFALLVAISEGSTRVPLAPANSTQDASFLQEQLARFHLALTLAAEQAKGDKKAAEYLAAASSIERIRNANPTALLDAADLPTLLAKVDATMTADDIPYHPLLLSDTAQGRSLTTERMLRKEDVLAESFMLRAGGPDPITSDDLDIAIAELAKYPTHYHDGKTWHAQLLNAEQTHAAQLAARSPLAFVTGGPGTGKTTIIVTVLRLMMRMGIEPGEIALAAPTGKAAYRMRESAIEQLDSLDITLADGPTPALPSADFKLMAQLPDARTLHRLLEYSPGRDIFWRNKENPIEAKVVICDEASMIDLDMMHALIDALGEHTRLILVGDADQLPPIGGGQPFRDLIGEYRPTHALPDGPSVANNSVMSRFTARLEHSYRMDARDQGGAEILALAKAVLKPADTKLSAHLKRTISRTALSQYLVNPRGVAQLDASDASDASDAKKEDEDNIILDDFLGAWFKRFVAIADKSLLESMRFEMTDDTFTNPSFHAIQAAFDHHAQARILCLTQVAKTGARAINKTLHQHFFEKHATAEKHLKNRPKFLHLEPVMLTQNNYDLQIFNGDIGLVARVARNGKTPALNVIFPRSGGGFRAVSLQQISGQIGHAYATSVHKSQGSEFEHIALMLPLENMALLNKPLLYTAITRASKSVTLLDPARLFAHGAATDLVRHTGLPERLTARG